MKRIVSRFDIDEKELGDASGVIKDYLDEALGRYGVKTFAQIGAFWFLNGVPCKHDCFSIGFDVPLSKVKFDYTDEIHLISGSNDRVLLNPTFIAPENDYVLSLFVFRDQLDEATRKNIEQYTDVVTRKVIA